MHKCIDCGRETGGGFSGNDGFRCWDCHEKKEEIERKTTGRILPIGSCYECFCGIQYSSGGLARCKKGIQINKSGIIPDNCPLEKAGD